SWDGAYACARKPVNVAELIRMRAERPCANLVDGGRDAPLRSLPVSPIAAKAQRLRRDLTVEASLQRHTASGDIPTLRVLVVADAHEHVHESRTRERGVGAGRLPFPRHDRLRADEPELRIGDAIGPGRQRGDAPAQRVHAHDQLLRAE